VSFLEAILTHPGKPWALRNLRTGRLVATDLEAAFDSASRRTGLLGRTGLADGSALIIAPCSGVHTFFMKFPIDVIFVGKDGTVTRVVKQLPPWRIGVSLRAFAAVETAAGTAVRTGTCPGDQLRLEVS
jgi:uncharacterized membrane protein (UPF0127 family)